MRAMMLVVSFARGGKLVSLKVSRAEIEADIYIFYRLGLLIREMCLKYVQRKPNAVILC